MAFPLIFFLVLSSLSTISISHSNPAAGLTDDYYAQTCPDFQKIMQETVTTKQIDSPTTAGAVLRVFFHDCMVDGCDASVLVSSTAFNQAERDADINHSLPGDAFDLVTRAKQALELTCPGVVSCADILAVAARNLVKIAGGPFLNIKLGRKDGLVSSASRVEPNLARPNTSVDQILNKFRSKGFTVEDTVALIGGGHTIGFTHCKEFSNRIFNFSEKSEVDPSLNPKYAERLREMCGDYRSDPTMAAFNDPLTPGKFDNMYFQNLFRGLVLLSSDQALMEDPRTRPAVEVFAGNQTAFFGAFAKAMEKTSQLGVKTGGDGEVRARCDAFNTAKTS